MQYEVTQSITKRREKMKVMRKKAVNVRYEQYLESFLADNEVKDVNSYKSLVSNIERVEKFITEWTNDDVSDFIKSLNTISPNSVLKYEQVIRKFYNHVCKVMDIEPIEIKLESDPKWYINFFLLESVTLDVTRFNWLKKLLVVEVDEFTAKQYGFSTAEVNHRDSVLLSLAWNGLTKEEIKKLKSNDITIGYERISIQLPKGRVKIIYDQELAGDLKKCINAEYYYINETFTRPECFKKLRSSEYLIRPVETRESKNEYCSDPNQLLHTVLNKLDGAVPGIDLNLLTLEDIRRSRIINLFRTDEAATIEDARDFLDKRSGCDIYWMRGIGEMFARLDARRKEMYSKHN